MSKRSKIKYRIWKYNKFRHFEVAFPYFLVVYSFKQKMTTLERTLQNYIFEVSTFDEIRIVVTVLVLDDNTKFSLHSRLK